ncbi:MAG TPA: hypothetical protein VLK29_06020, partial [Luteimonas sp.]|nr:hypothetical protein [Luteimonas sp.]
AAYDAHVCKRFDREWLAAQRIRYVFLPADRLGACMASMDQLRLTDEVVAESGDSALIRLRSP